MSKPPVNQDQRGGIGSQNIQIATAIFGPGPDEVRAIAKEVFDANFSQLTQSAGETASIRAEDIRERIVSELSSNPAANASSFSQVEKQVALLDAQKGYALSGDENLRDLLVAAVTEISQQPERSLKSIVLHEAIKVMPMLTFNQLRIVAAVFAFRYIHWGAPILQIVLNNITKSFDATSAPLTVSDGDLRHIEYVGCGKTSIANISFPSVLREEYVGLFSLGFTLDELKAEFAPEPPPPQPFIVASPTASPPRFRINAHNTHRIDALVKELTPRQKEVVTKLFTLNPPTDDQIISMTTEAIPAMGELQTLWDERRLGHFELTSVGIAVGHTIASTKTEIGADLSIWM